MTAHYKATTGFSVPRKPHTLEDSPSLQEIPRLVLSLPTRIFGSPNPSLQIKIMYVPNISSTQLKMAQIVYQVKQPQMLLQSMIQYHKICNECIET